MKATDLKQVIIPQVGVRYSAKEQNVEVYGSDSIGYNVWVTIGNRSAIINPKGKKYANKEVAVEKANHYLKNQSLYLKQILSNN
jgi:hypothetical protein